MKYFLTFTIFLALVPYPGKAQLVDEQDESRFYAESKQVNQFFRRFNGEEDEKGKRYASSDKLYRSSKLRRQYLSMLFDASNAGMSRELIADFSEQVLKQPGESILQFHGGEWFAEVRATFIIQGKPAPVTLYMQIEKDHLGSKWVIQKAQIENFRRYFVRDTSRIGRFLHPLSHELDFMNLRKAFANSDSLSQYTVKQFVPDHLSVLLYEVKRGNMAFSTVESVKFHFFQLKGWYFELSEFNRSGYNTGWLISNLVKLKNDSEKDLLKRYLYRENK